MKLKSIGIVVTLVLTMFMAAIESSIISLALPTIRKDLNAGTAVPLVFTVYFIALVVANPIVGELLTRFKILYIAVVGILLFGIGSFMSGINYFKSHPGTWRRSYDVFDSNCTKTSI